jgi:MFS family permease
MEFSDSMQADSLEVLVIGQAFEGVPWGFFIANSPAYASEIVPLALRSACAASLQMSWAIGSIIVAGISYAYNQRDDQWSWRMPAALQWIFPVSICPHKSINRSVLTCAGSPHGPSLLRAGITLVATSPRSQAGSFEIN